MYLPNAFGSGGGGAMNGSGLGGGVLRFHVDRLIVDGTVTAGGRSEERL